MTPYHRLISAWVLLDKIKEIPGYLKRLGLPMPAMLDALIKKPTNDRTVSRFCRWFTTNGELDADLDVVYYRILPVVGIRKTMNTLLLLGYTPETLSKQMMDSHRLPVSPEVVSLYRDLCWDTDIDYHLLLRTVNDFKPDEKEAYMIALTGTQWEAELEAGVVPNISVKSLLKLITAAGFKSVNQLLKLRSYHHPEKVLALALKAADLLKDMETVNNHDVATALAFELELVKEDSDPEMSQLQLDFIDTSVPEEANEGVDK